MEPSALELKAIARADELKSSLAHAIPSEANVRRAIVDMFACFEGISEIGKTNTGYLVNQFHRDLSTKDRDPLGMPWCVIVYQATVLYVCQGFGKPDLLPYNTPSTQSAAKWAEDLGIANRIPAKVGMGDAMVQRDGLDDGTGHMACMVEPGFPMYTEISGNTNSAGSSNGGMILTRKVAWSRWEVTSPQCEFPTHPTKRYMRCTIPVNALMARFWGD